MNQVSNGGRVRIAEPGSQETLGGAESQHHLHSHSNSTILNTQEYNQVTVEQFMEHVDVCGEPYKQEIMTKVKDLKLKDKRALQSFVTPPFSDP